VRTPEHSLFDVRASALRVLLVLTDMAAGWYPLIMVQQVHAIYENGILRPLEPLDLEEHELVSLAVVRASTNGPAGSREEQQARETVGIRGENEVIAGREPGGRLFQS
jgi:predicted DNA-binding antitoxin AbrB/MazE fold protein